MPGEHHETEESIQLGDVANALTAISAYKASDESRRRKSASTSLHVLESALSARMTRRSHLRARPNIFRVLGLETKEDTVSRMVVWLLDPRESHGLGSAFLLDFLLAIARSQKGDNDVLARILRDPAIWSYRVAREVGRGNSRADIVVDGPEGRVVIETKLSSTEGEKQTRRYAKALRRRRGTVFVYLAPDGADPPESGLFITFRYSELFGLLDAVKTRYQLHPDTASLLDQFKSSMVSWAED